MPRISPQGSDSTNNLQQITNEISQHVEMICSCQFTADNIVEEEFSNCRASAENTIVYRAKVRLQVPVLEIDVNDVVEIISSWVQTAPSFVVNGLRIRIDPSCPIVLESYDEEDCFVMSTTTSSFSVQGPSIGIIVGATVAAVVVIILIVVIIVITTLHCRVKSSYR